MRRNLHLLSLRVQVAALWAAWASGWLLFRHWQGLLLAGLGLGVLALVA